MRKIQPLSVNEILTPDHDNKPLKPGNRRFVKNQAHFMTSAGLFMEETAGFQDYSPLYVILTRRLSIYPVIICLKNAFD